VIFFQQTPSLAAGVLVLLANMHCQNNFFIELLFTEWALILFLRMAVQQMPYSFEQLRTGQLGCPSY
jgi:hypothetical protein